MQHPHLMQTPPWLLEDSCHNGEPNCWQYVIWMWINWREAQDCDKTQQFGRSLERGAMHRGTSSLLQFPCCFGKGASCAKATPDVLHIPGHTSQQDKGRRHGHIFGCALLQAWRPPPSKTPAPSSRCAAGGCCGAAGCWPDTAGCGGSSSSSFGFGRDKVALK